MKVLITGGAGFIGSHLAEVLLARGDEVHLLDDLSTGSIENIVLIKNHPNLTYHIDTIRNYRLTAELVDTCDIVYHLAAAVGVKLIVRVPAPLRQTFAARISS
jgi:UDP-glucose 4-epimerase